MKLEIRQLGSWREFLKEIDEKFLRNRGYVFRGQPCRKPVLSSFRRLEKEHPTCQFHGKKNGKDVHLINPSPPASPDVHLNAFREAASGRLDPVFAATLSENEWWALAAHHGLKTPLIDWTQSPYIALYFAFSTSLPRQHFRSVYAISWAICNKPGNPIGPNNPTLFVPDRQISPNLVMQQGVLMALGAAKDVVTRDLKERIKAMTMRPKETFALDGHPFIRFDIPDKDRGDCLLMLDKMNINEGGLFPDLNGAARRVNQLWEMSFHTTLGQFIVTLPQDSKEGAESGG
jgi:hypothetical protein